MSVSVLVQIKERFSGRILEWYVATQLFCWGLVLIAPDAGLSDPVADVFASVGFNEWRLGLAMLAIGVIRLMALIINGAVPNVTPFVRIGGAFLGCGVWYFISLGLLMASLREGHFGVWVAAWPFACIAEFINMFRAAQDARVGVRKAKMKVTHGGRS